MAIKERKQITGTEAQIKGYAGHNGVLAYATDTKHLHVLSGTAGASTKLANVSDIPDISGKADKTYVDTELAKKQATGDYATNSALTTGLAGKLDATGKAQTAGTADTAKALASTAKVPYSQLTGTPSFPDAIPKEGDRGAIAGYEQWTKVGTSIDLSVSSGDAVLMQISGRVANIYVQPGSVDQIATKLVWVSSSNGFIMIHGITGWFGEAAPLLNKKNAALLFFFHDGNTDCRLIGQWD